jgi:membrane protein implicated in regulation of membrane protease activity
LTYTWLALALLFIFVEFVTPQLVSIWVSLGSFAALVISLLGGPVWLQVGLFLVVSVIAILTTRSLYRKYVKQKAVPTNADALIEKTAVVLIEINNLEAVGQVKVNGQIWSAKNMTDHIIPEGSLVIVKEIVGVKMIVEEIKQSNI